MPVADCCFELLVRFFRRHVRHSHALDMEKLVDADAARDYSAVSGALKREVPLESSKLVACATD